MSKISKTIAVIGLTVSLCGCSPASNTPQTNVSEEAKKAFQTDPGFEQLGNLQKEAQNSAKSIDEAGNVENSLNQSTQNL